ncbi:DUF3887 domain-containing protein [Bacillus sp. NPDC094106]|uniref:DUF3887 domain-containing protein n=1 Tax=Bacillus sp. NPDC094106 TaxID=3363949 RepID=UPI0037F838BF
MKRILLTMLSAMVVFALVACGSNKVDEKASKKYITKAEEIVSLLNEGKYNEVHAKFDNQMKAGLPEDKMKELTPLIEKSGKFEKIDKSSVEEKDGMYVVILVAKYSKENRVFTVSFNDKEEVAGLFIK